MEASSQKVPLSKGNAKTDITVIPLHSHHFENPQELSSVLKTFWDDNKFSVEMQNDMYIVRVSGPPAESKSKEFEGAHDITSLIKMANRKKQGKEIGVDTKGG